MIALVFLLFAGGCVMPAMGPEESLLSGQPVDETKAKSIKVNQTTKAEIIDRLGPPSLVWQEGNILAYRWERVEANYVAWDAFLGPLFGPWGGGELKSAHALLLQFDRRNKLCRIKRVEPPLHAGFGNPMIGTVMKRWSKEGGSSCANQ